MIRTLQLARQRGYVLAIASGRPLCLVTESLLRAGVMDYAICSNGAIVTSLRDNAVVVQRTLPRDVALGCIHALEPFSPAWNGFFDHQAFFEWKGASYMIFGRADAVARSGGHVRGLVGAIPRLTVQGLRFAKRLLSNGSHHQVWSLITHLSRARGGIEKIGCTIADPQECDAAAQLLRDVGLFEVMRMGRSELEITARGVTKGSGARWLIDALRMDAKRCVAFGDGGNDLPLSDVVGRFVAMGNADESVKQAADDVCPTVYEDGVAVWIEKNLLGLQDTSCYAGNNSRSTERT